MNDPKPGHVPQTYPGFAFAAMGAFVLLVVGTGLFKVVPAVFGAVGQAFSSVFGG
jgi:hypothetical protein